MTASKSAAVTNPTRWRAFADNRRQNKMIGTRDITYDTNENSDQVLSRLTWAVEKIDGLTWQLLNNTPVDTNRPWIGVYDKDKKEFGLVEPGGLFGFKIFQIVVRGQIDQDGERSKIHVQLRLGWHTLTTYLFIYGATLFFTIMTAIYGELTDMLWIVVFIIVFPVLGTVILNRKLDKVEKKVEQLFSVG
jgi:ABC-type multidrug transport system fused ATPase/permease subunit